MRCWVVGLLEAIYHKNLALYDSDLHLMTKLISPMANLISMSDRLRLSLWLTEGKAEANMHVHSVTDQEMIKQSVSHH